MEWKEVHASSAFPPPITMSPLVVQPLASCHLGIPGWVGKSRLGAGVQAPPTAESQGLWKKASYYNWADSTPELLSTCASVGVPG